MSQCTSADESWLDPMTQLTGQQLGHDDITLHLHHHGDTSIPHPIRAGRRLGNKTNFWWFVLKKSEPLTRQQLWVMWILSLCFWENIIRHWITRGLFVFYVNLKMLQILQWLIWGLFLSPQSQRTPAFTLNFTQASEHLGHEPETQSCTNIKSS